MAFGGCVSRNRCEIRNAAGKLVCSATVLDGPNEHAVIQAIVNTVFMTKYEAKLYDIDGGDSVTVAEVSLTYPHI